LIGRQYFGENRLILLQTVSKWRCTKLCAIFSGPLCIYCRAKRKYCCLGLTYH